MNERQALEFIMSELKEQRRQDFDMYFEMRKNITATYERFLDRLRELDEADRLLNGVSAREEPREPKREQELKQTVANIFKQLPVPKSHDMTYEQVRDERVDEKKIDKRMKKAKVDYVDITTEVERFLKEQPRPVKLRKIREHAENHFNTEWANFNSVMRSIIELSPYIQIDKSGKKDFLYYYKEV